MNKTLKALAVCASVLALGVLPAYAQAGIVATQPAASGPVAAPVPSTAAPAPVAAPAVAPQERAASYDEVKGDFKNVVDAVTAALNGPQVSHVATDMQSHIDNLAKIQQEYNDAQSKPGFSQADRDAFVQKYLAEVKAIQTDVVVLSSAEQQVAKVVNAGLDYLQQIDAKKAQSDPDITAMVDGLQKLINAKIAAPIDNAEKAIGPLMQSTQRAVQARLQAITAEELNRAIANQLATQANQ